MISNFEENVSYETRARGGVINQQLMQRNDIPRCRVYTFCVSRRFIYWRESVANASFKKIGRAWMIQVVVGEWDR